MSVSGQIRCIDIVQRYLRPHRKLNVDIVSHNVLRVYRRVCLNCACEPRWRDMNSKAVGEGFRVMLKKRFCLRRERKKRRGGAMRGPSSVRAFRRSRRRLGSR